MKWLQRKRIQLQDTTHIGMFLVALQARHKLPNTKSIRKISKASTRRSVDISHRASKAYPPQRQGRSLNAHLSHQLRNLNKACAHARITQTFTKKAQINRASLPTNFHSNAPLTSAFAQSSLAAALYQFRWRNSKLNCKASVTYTALPQTQRRAAKNSYKSRAAKINARKRTRLVALCRRAVIRPPYIQTHNTTLRRWTSYIRRAQHIRRRAACASPVLNSRSFWPPHITAKAITTILLAAVAAIRSPSRCIAVA